ncbi:unnamed protein product [Chrysoparadoxa australica]
MEMPDEAVGLHAPLGISSPNGIASLNPSPEVSPAPSSRHAAGKLTTNENTAAELAKGKLERMLKVEALVEKRKNCFAYLKKLHQGDTYWLNCVLMRRETDLKGYARDLPTSRSEKFFYLGVSLARLLRSSSGAELVVKIAQLMEELDFHYASNASQASLSPTHSVKVMMAKGGDHPFPVHNNIPDTTDEHVVIKLYKFNNEVVYEHLMTPHIPFGLEYLEVAISLCDVISLIYTRFMDEQCYTSPFVFEALMKVDARMKHHVLNAAAKEFTEASLAIIKDELHHLREPEDDFK